ncbi:MAG TPA: DUF4440 domain-containing protein [Pyrinomonadaceae bacterium]
MKRVCVIALLVFAASSLASGQDNSGQEPKNTKIEQEIRRLEREWFDSYISGDRAAFDRIVADDVVITYGNGRVGNKSEAMVEIKTAADSSYSLTSDEIQVRVYGDTAVVTGRVTEKGTFNGRNVNSQSRYTDVWLRRNGRWQVVAAQNTRLPQARPTAAMPSVTPNVSDANVGQYELAPNLIIAISRDGDRLFSEVGGRRSELASESDNRFSFPSANIKITFVKDANGQVTHMIVNDNGREGQARKIR